MSPNIDTPETTEAQRAGQGTIIPTMLLGLGGTGSRIVDRIAARAAHLPNWESQLRPLTSFVSIDTNELDQHKLRFVPEGNRLNIAAFDKSRVVEHYRRSREPQALQWLDKGYQPRPGFKPGAGQIRVESRLGFFYHSPEIRQRLEELVKASLQPGITWRQSNPPKYYVYVFSTLAGGTGSGCFLSTAYLLRDVIEQQNWQPRLIGNFLLSTLMTDTVGPELHPDIHANTYAALKELEHLTKLDYPRVQKEGRDSEPFVYFRDENRREVQKVRNRPFFLSFLFDRPPHLGLHHADRAIADAAFLQIFTPIIDNLAGELDNYEKNLQELTHLPGELKNVGLGYAKNYGAFGAVALTLPGEDLLEYCALRFAGEAIRSQITFGVDPTDATDERARALARHAVDYADPKFLNMSDEGREREINKAFVASVREMARQDEREELTEGFWYRLVESVDEGRLTGTDDEGEPIRNESLLDAVSRRLEDDRKRLLNQVSIRERAFVFHREGVNQYVEYVDRLREDARSARRLVDEGAQGLETSAVEGEPITDLELDPITERYLVLRLLDRCENQWLPESKSELEKAKARSLESSNVRERLEKELYENLQEAADTKSWFGKDQAFLDARAEAHEYYRKVISAMRQFLEADTALRQLRALHDYLQRRARQYARLANRMDGLVSELERQAERLRRGESSLTPVFALRVEVFETLDEPRRRLWDRVFHELFVEGPRYFDTFDRRTLATTVSAELAPVVGPDGRVKEKTLEQMVGDLRQALTDLGRRRLRPRILGTDGDPGLDLARGLDLEARIVLGPSKREGQGVTDDEIEAYREKKFRALAQIAGVLARVSSAESKALDDGVKTNRTRQLILGLDDEGGRGAADFVRRLTDLLSAGGRQVKTDRWHDPRLIVVHDVELPVPLYYIQPVVAEVEDAYLRLARDERRSYQLHTDYHWEESLPNLNPRRSEITVGWALRMVGQGLVTGAFAVRDGRWLWKRDGATKPMVLGETLSEALYRVGEIHRTDNLSKALEQQVRSKASQLSEDDLETRHRELRDLLQRILNDIEARKLDGAVRSEDLLDKPVFQTLLHQIETSGDGDFDAPAVGVGTGRLDFEK